MTDLLKLKLINTKKKIGSYYEYDIVGQEMPNIDTVLVKHVGDDIDMLILFKDDTLPTLEPVSEASFICSAGFVSLGLNKISVIRKIREATNWGLKESKDFVESFPTRVKVGEVSKEVLRAMVDGVNAEGGTANFTLGKCDACDLRFRCFTTR